MLKLLDSWTGPVWASSELSIHLVLCTDGFVFRQWSLERVNRQSLFLLSAEQSCQGSCLGHFCWIIWGQNGSKWDVIFLPEAKVISCLCLLASMSRYVKVMSMCSPSNLIAIYCHLDHSTSWPWLALIGIWVSNTLGDIEIPCQILTPGFRHLRTLAVPSNNFLRTMSSRKHQRASRTPLAEWKVAPRTEFARWWTCWNTVLTCTRSTPALVGLDLFCRFHVPLTSFLVSCESLDSFLESFLDKFPLTFRR